MTDHVGAARRIIEPRLEMIVPLLYAAQGARTPAERLALLHEAQDLLLACGSAAMDAIAAEVRDAGTEAVLVLAERIRRHGASPDARERAGGRHGDPLKLVEG